MAVIENNIIPPLIRLLTDADYEIKNWAGQAISNTIRYGNIQQIKVLVDQGCIRPLFTWLHATESNGGNCKLLADFIEHFRTTFFN